MTLNGRTYPSNRMPSVVIGTTVIMLFIVAAFGLFVWGVVSIIVAVVGDPTLAFANVGNARSAPAWVAFIACALGVAGCAQILGRNLDFLIDLYVGKPIEMQTAKRRRAIKRRRARRADSRR